jgi:hypothetical protein
LKRWLRHNRSGLTGANKSEDDEEEEEMVLLINELLTARKNVFTVMTVAQSIQDLGPDSGEQIINGVKCQEGRYDAGGDRILATSRMLSTVYRDALTGEISIIGQQFLED